MIIKNDKLIICLEIYLKEQDLKENILWITILHIKYANIKNTLNIT